jgi:hypothetical protein
LCSSPLLLSSTSKDKETVLALDSLPTAKNLLKIGSLLLLISSCLCF